MSDDLASHRLLSDGYSAALIRPDGKIDWWCTPRFDASPTFWALLDPTGASAHFLHVRALPVAEMPIGPTTVTTLRAAGGRIEVRDGVDDGRVLRLVRGVDAALDVVHETCVGGFDLRAARGPFRRRLVAPTGCWVALELREDGQALVNVDEASDTLDRAAARAHADADALAARHHELRVRDAIAVIRACTFRPSGATIAAPTTSIPEAPGGDRQFDYRYAWLRDGSLAAAVSAYSGRLDLAEEHLAFLRMLGPRVFEAPVFAADGSPVPDEREVPGLAGPYGSKPVRVGNAARTQMQYDALGFVVEAVATYVRLGGPLDRALWHIVRDIADRCCVRPERETGGIWELRRPRDLLSADIGRWLALDRAITLARIRRPWMRRRHWIAARDECRDAVLAELRPDGRLPQVYSGSPDILDASALLIVLFGMVDRRDPRARAIVDAHVRLLGDGPFVSRYSKVRDDGFTGEEGAFVPCSWWAVSALAQLGELDQARARADALCAALPRLLAEEFDPGARASRGNFPLVWSHAELARAMHLLDLAAVRHKGGPVAAAGRQFTRITKARTRVRSRRR